MEEFTAVLAKFKSADAGDRIMAALAVTVIVIGVLNVDWLRKLLLFVAVGTIAPLLLMALIKGALIILYTPIPGW